MKKLITAALLAAGALAAAPLAQADETVTICPDGRSGVAQGQTSCAFAHNVRAAWYGQAGTVVQAYSPVTGGVYSMQCGTGYQINTTSGMRINAVRCVGGDNAVVWVW